jgi:hypothetical protein
MGIRIGDVLQNLDAFFRMRQSALRASLGASAIFNPLQIVQ